MTTNTAAVGTVGAVVAFGAGGPLAQVFNELALVLLMMGMIGGGLHGLTNRLPWRAWIRGVIIGGGLSFGLGVLGPPILAAQFSIDVGPGNNTVPMLAASSFAIGYLQDILITWLGTKPGGKDAP